MPLYGLLSPLDSSTPTIRIDKKNFTVGKDQSCDVVLRAPGIQSVHSHFTVNHNNELFVKRCSAQSRVSVGGQEVTCASRIKLGDRIQLGDANFIFDKAPVQETPLRSKSVTSALSNDVKTKQLHYEPEGERKVGQELRCDDKLEFLESLTSTEGAHERDGFVEETHGNKSLSQQHSYEMTPAFVTPREHGYSAYCPSTGGAIFETPCFEDTNEQAISASDTLSDDANKSITQGTVTLVSYPSSIVSPSSNNGISEISNSFNTDSHCEGMSKSKIIQSDETVTAIDVGNCFAATPGVSPDLSISLPEVLSEFTKLSITAVDASIMSVMESCAITKTVYISDKQFSSATVRLAKPIAHTETEDTVDSVKPSTSSAQGSGKLGRNKQRRGNTLSTETPTSQGSDSSPIASRTRSHTILRLEIEKAPLKSATAKRGNPLLKSGGRSVERKEGEVTAGCSCPTPKRQKAVSTFIGRKRRRLRTTEDDPPINQRKTRGVRK